MIFIGPNFSRKNNHFVANVIDAIGSERDLIVDVLVDENRTIFEKIQKHVKTNREKYIIYSVKEDEDFLFSIKKYFSDLIFIMFFSDDEWRHNGYDRYLALFSDCFVITGYQENLKKYMQYGLTNAILSRWACNPDKYYPIVEQKREYDVSFIGAPNKKRIEYISYLNRSGIDVRVFGYGWDSVKELRGVWGGKLSDNGFNEVVNKTKINLNFLWNTYGGTNIKGRTFEIPACGGFQMSLFNYELQRVGFEDDVNISLFDSKEEMLKKIQHFLKNKKHRKQIAQRGYELVIENHTWKKRFEEIFHEADKAVKPVNILRDKKLVVLVAEGVTHKIKLPESRFMLEIHKLNNFSREKLKNYDAIIVLENNSTLNNDALYMMLFALKIDSSDIVFANYYLDKKQSLWVRFRELEIKDRRLKKHLNSNVVMYSAKYYFGNTKNRESNKLSYIEYPLCYVETSWINRIVLGIAYCYTRDTKKTLRMNLLEAKILPVFIVIMKKLVKKHGS